MSYFIEKCHFQQSGFSRTFIQFPRGHCCILYMPIVNSITYSKIQVKTGTLASEVNFSLFQVTHTQVQATYSNISLWEPICPSLQPNLQHIPIHIYSEVNHTVWFAPEYMYTGLNLGTLKFLNSLL